MSDELRKTLIDIALALFIGMGLLTAMVLYRIDQDSAKLDAIQRDITAFKRAAPVYVLRDR